MLQRTHAHLPRIALPSVVPEVHETLPAVAEAVGIAAVVDDRESPWRAPPPNQWYTSGMEDATTATCVAVHASASLRRAAFRAARVAWYASARSPWSARARQAPRAPQSRARSASRRRVGVSSSPSRPSARVGAPSTSCEQILQLGRGGRLLSQGSSLRLRGAARRRDPRGSLRGGDVRGGRAVSVIGHRRRVSAGAVAPLRVAPELADLGAARLETSHALFDNLRLHAPLALGHRASSAEESSRSSSACAVSSSCCNDPSLNELRIRRSGRLPPFRVRRRMSDSSSAVALGTRFSNSITRPSARSPAGPPRRAAPRPARVSASSFSASADAVASPPNAPPRRACRRRVARGRRAPVRALLRLGDSATSVSSAALSSSRTFWISITENSFASETAAWTAAAVAAICSCDLGALGVRLFAGARWFELGVCEFFFGCVHRAPSPPRRRAFAPRPRSRARSILPLPSALAAATSPTPPPRRLPGPTHRAPPPRAPDLGLGARRRTLLRESAPAASIGAAASATAPSRHPPRGASSPPRWPRSSRARRLDGFVSAFLRFLLDLVDALFRSLRRGHRVSMSASAFCFASSPRLLDLLLEIRGELVDARVCRIADRLRLLSPSRTPSSSTDATSASASSTAFATASFAAAPPPSSPPPPPLRAPRQSPTAAFSCAATTRRWHLLLLLLHRLLHLRLGSLHMPPSSSSFSATSTARRLLGGGNLDARDLLRRVRRLLGARRTPP